MTIRALIVLGASCSEYQFGNKLDKGNDDGDGSAPDETFGACQLDTSPTDVSVDDSCADGPSTSFESVIEWSDESMGMGAQSAPVVGQLTDDDGDGDVDLDDMPDIVVPTYAGKLTVLSGDGSGVHWRAPGFDYAIGTAAIGDLDGDGRADIAMAATTGDWNVRAVRGSDGSTLWQVTVPEITPIATSGGVGIYDLDRDGHAEVVMGHVVLDGQTGEVRGIGAHGMVLGTAFGVAADILGDGDLEVVTGNALYDVDGRTLWFNDEPDGFVAVANFDDDEEGEIVVCWTSAPYEGGPEGQGLGTGRVRLQDDDGTVLWQTSVGWGAGPPTIADYDGDGEPEIGVASSRHFSVLEGDGTVSWQSPTEDISSAFTGSSAFDFDGDGAEEVVYADEHDVWVFDGVTGAVKLQETEHASPTCSEYPVVADVDNDGHAEIVYTSFGLFTGPEFGLRVLGDVQDSWMPGRAVWNQYAYAITNIDDVGTVPENPARNWPEHNNFRSGTAPGDAAELRGSDAIPLPGDACELECDAGTLYLVVRIGNVGTHELPAGVPCTLYTDGDVVLETFTTSAPIAPGESSEGHVFAVPTDALGEELWVVADDDGSGRGKVGECREDNNRIALAATDCG